MLIRPHLSPADNRRIQAMLFGNQNGDLRQQLLDGAPFLAELTHTAVPQRAAPGTTATFTRATTATVQNNDGYLVTALAGEARFVGARRIDNLIRLGAAQSSTLAVAANVTMTLPAGKYVFSMGAGTGTATFSGTGGATGTLAASALVRTEVSKTITAGTLIVTASVATLTDIQVESVDAQTTQTAGEYVSVGVESAPYYHGSMVDGVKCFDTDLSGNPLTTMLGYSAEGARTNLCLQSNAFTTTWVDVSATLSPVQNAIGPDGATSAWTLNDNSAVFREEVAQDIVLTAAAHTYSVFVKKTTGAQTGYPVLWVTTGGTTISLCTIDTTNGVATVWTAYTGLSIAGSSSARCVSYNDNFWRVSLTFTGTAATWSHRITPAGTTNATQATGVMDAAAQASHVFYGAQVELGSFASSYIATTTAAVTRNADVLTYSSAGNIDGTKGWCYAEISTYWNTAPPANWNAVGFGASIEGLIVGGVTGAPTEIRAYDGSNSVTQSSNPTMYFTPRDTAMTWGGSSMSVAQSGVATSGSFDGNIGTTAIGVGNSGTGTGQWNGPIRNVRIGQRQLSASEQQAITS